MNKENIPPRTALKVNKSTKRNKVPTLTQQGKWTSEALEEVMNVVKTCATSLMKVSKFWYIPLTSLSNHLNGRTRSKKVGLAGVVMNEKDKTFVIYILGM
jgi:hypothetical protein